MNEAETRADHIDPQLAAAGWGVVEDSRIRREFPITLSLSVGSTMSDMRMSVWIVSRGQRWTTAV